MTSQTAGSDHLPQLPLMLAGVPRPIAELLRETGIPTAPLPRVALTASGTGRFVLYDSRSVTSAVRAKRAKRQGLEPIDVASFASALGDRSPTWGALDRTSPTVHMAARTFLEQLKLELEIRGGVWLRLADYPFPYQSAIAIAVEHASEDLAELGELTAALPHRLTHLVSSRIVSEGVDRLLSLGEQDLGWFLESEAFEFSAKKTLAEWSKRLARFTTAGLAIRGLAREDSSLVLPPRGSLRDLGFTYSAHGFAGVACQTEPAVRDTQQAFWVQFGTMPLADTTSAGVATDRQAPRPSTGNGPLSSHSNSPNLNAALEAHQRIDAAHVLGPDAASPGTDGRRRHDWMMEWVREHYQSGHPLFLRERTTRPDLLSELQSVVEHATRCSLMWQSTLGDFASWWKARRQMELQVWRRDDAYEIHATGDFGIFPWSIEIWRGAHLATLPFKQPLVNIRDDGLVFLRAHNKSPAGITVPNEHLQGRIGTRAPQHLQTS